MYRDRLQVAVSLCLAWRSRWFDAVLPLSVQRAITNGHTTRRFRQAVY